MSVRPGGAALGHVKVGQPRVTWQASAADSSARIGASVRRFGGGVNLFLSLAQDDLVLRLFIMANHKVVDNLSGLGETAACPALSKKVQTNGVLVIA